MAVKYNYNTQKLANLLYSGSRGRDYRYSTYQQLFNVITEQTDSFKKSVFDYLSSLNVFTYDHNELDVVYQAGSIPSNTTYTESEYSDIYDWHHKTLPSKLIKIDSINIQTDSLSTELEFTSNKCELNLYVNEADVFIDLNESFAVYNKPLEISIYGFVKPGIFIKEIVSFNYPSIKKSKYRWIFIAYIETSDSQKSVYLKYSPGHKGSFTEDPHIVIYRPEETDIPYSVFCGSDASKVTYYIPTSADIEIWHSGLGEMEVIEEFMLLDGTGSEISPAGVYFSDDRYIYAIDNSYVYCYDKCPDIPLLAATAEAERSYDPMVKLFVDVNESINIAGNYNHIRLDKSIVAYRFLYTTDGQSYKVYDPTDGQWKAFNGQWFDYNPKNTIGFLSKQITLDKELLSSADLLFKIDVRLSDGSIESDTYLLARNARVPLWQLEHNIENPLDIFINSKRMLTIVSQENGSIIYNVFKLVKGTYFKMDDGQYIFDHIPDGITVFPVNVHTKIDDIATLAGLNTKLNDLDSITGFIRQEGETTYEFIDYLLYALFNPPSGNLSGMQNALALSTRNLPKIAAILTPKFVNNATKAQRILTHYGKYTGLDNTGTFIINPQDEAYETFDDICNAIADYFEVPYKNLNVSSKLVSFIKHIDTLNYELKSFHVDHETTKVFLPLMPDEVIYDVRIDGLSYQLSDDRKAVIFDSPQKDIVIWYNVIKSYVLLQYIPFEIIEYRNVLSTPNGADVLNLLDLVYPTRWSK